MKNSLLFLSLISSLSVFSQTVETFFTSTTVKIDDALLFDKEGNLYGSNYTGSNVYRITPQGDATIFVSGLNTPNGLAFDSQENLWVNDLDGNRVYKISKDGTPLDTFVIPNPSGIVKMPASDTMLITQFKSNIVSKLAPDGTLTPIFSGAPLDGPVGICFDETGQLYVANFNNRMIFRMENNVPVKIAQLPSTNNGWLGFIVPMQGSLWATNFRDNKIYRVFQNHTDSIQLYAGSSAGSTDGPIATAKLNGPNGIIPGPDGNSLYISDYNSKRIRKISGISTGIFDFTPTSQFKIFPNPCSDILHFKTPKDFSKYEVIDISGKAILSGAVSQKNQSVDISTIKTGNYFLRVTNAQGNIVQHEFVKE